MASDGAALTEDGRAFHVRAADTDIGKLSLTWCIWKDNIMTLRRNNDAITQQRRTRKVYENLCKQVQI